MARYIGLDLGTSNVRICTPEAGTLMSRPTAAAIDSRTHEIMALGKEARGLLGKTPDSILSYRPIKDGVVSDFEVTALMLDAYFSRLKLRSTFRRPNVLLATPYSISEVERLAAENAVLDAGAKRVAKVPAVFAAAVGANLRVSSPKGCMILNIGGGITEVAIISSNGIVNAHCVRMAGERMDVAIVNYMLNRRGLRIGDTAAEDLKIQIGTANPAIDRGSATVYGLKSGDGLAAAVNVTSAEICEAISPIINGISRLVLITLREVQPEVFADIHEYGLMLTGGCALIPGIGQAISHHTGLRVTLAKNPDKCVIVGLQRIIDNPSLWGEELFPPEGLFSFGKYGQGVGTKADGPSDASRYGRDTRRKKGDR